MCGKYTNGRLYCKACRADGVLLTFEESQTDGYKKKILLKERGHRCESCGLSEWLGKPIPLEMDHTDGNSDNSTRGNLKLLCPNCHAQTPTYRSKNIGKAGSRAAKRSRALKDTARELAKALYNWPSTGELKVMLMTLPMTRVAKKLGIPYKVFQKHCAEQGIASRGPGGWGFVVRDKTYNTDP
jgi:Zn finger protein HypA/HybF involved in hydrogenase expression